MFNGVELRKVNESGIQQGVTWKKIDLASSSDFGSESAIAYDSPSVQTYIAPKCILGSPYDANCLSGVLIETTYNSPGMSLLQFSDARVVGFESITTAAGLLNTSGGNLTGTSLKRHLSELMSFHYGYLLREIDGDWHCCSRELQQEPVEVDGALLISGVEPGNFGSFIVRMLPQLLFVAHTCPDIKFDCMIVPDRTPWMLEALDLLGLGGKQILTSREAVGFQFKKLFKITDFYHEGLLSPETVDRFSWFAKVCRDRCRPVIADTLYISRLLQSQARPFYRSLQNEAEIESVLQVANYKVFRPEEWSLAQQISTLSVAAGICGPSGSGMLLSAFAEQGVQTMDLESFTVTVRQHAKLYSSSGKKYGFCFGQLDESDPSDPSLRRWSVPIDALMSGLEVLKN